MNIGKLFLILSISLMLLSCSSSDSAPGSLSGGISSATLADTGEVHILRDDLQRMDYIFRVHYLDDRSFLGQVGTTLYRFEDHEMVQAYRNEGRGPCEYTSVDDIDSSGDSLFVFSHAQAKIITYRVSTGECLGELNMGDLGNHDYMERVRNGFITGLSSYTGLHDSTTILYRIGDDGSLEPLPLEKGMLNPVDSPFPSMLPLRDFARHGNRLYAYFPFTEVMTWYDMEKNEVHSFPLELDIKREEIEAADFFEARDIITEEQERVTRVLVSDRWVATCEFVNNGNTPDSYWVRFYSHEGDFLGRSIVDQLPVAEHNGRLVFLEEAESNPDDYAYRFTYRDVILE